MVRTGWFVKSTKLNIITDTGKKKNEIQLERVMYMYPQESMDGLLALHVFLFN